MAATELRPALATTGYVNLGVANANIGPASLTNVSQSMDQSLNTFAAAGGNNLTLNQSAINHNYRRRLCLGLCSNNIQVAAGSSGATISGAQQFITNQINVATVGSLSGNSHYHADDRRT